MFTWLDVLVRDAWFGCLFAYHIRDERAWRCSLSFSVVFLCLYIASALFYGGSCIAFSARRAFSVVFI